MQRDGRDRLVIVIIQLGSAHGYVAVCTNDYDGHLQRLSSGVIGDVVEESVAACEAT